MNSLCVSVPREPRQTKHPSLENTALAHFDSQNVSPFGWLARDKCQGETVQPSVSPGSPSPYNFGTFAWPSREEIESLLVLS
jgi:hypothetical protein